MVEDKFFVRINNAEEIKKNLLALSKDTILAMKRFHNLKKIRQEKNSCTQHVSKLFKEIENICQTMDFSAPEFGIGVEKTQNQEHKEEREEIKEYKQQKMDDKSKESYSTNEKIDDGDEYEEQLKRIEQSASEIEKKLRELV